MSFHIDSNHDCNLYSTSLREPHQKRSQPNAMKTRLDNMVFKCLWEREAERGRLAKGEAERHREAETGKERQIEAKRNRNRQREAETGKERQRQAKRG